MFGGCNYISVQSEMKTNKIKIAIVFGKKEILCIICIQSNFSKYSVTRRAFESTTKRTEIQTNAF